MLHLGRPRCVMVVAPHSDDETIGAHALMSRLVAGGVAVRVVVVSDGSASHPGSLRWPRARLVRERQRETRRAMRHLGVAAGSVAFLGLPDGRLDVAPAIAFGRIAAMLRRAPKPMLVVAPGPTDDHPDHRVVAAAVAAPRIAGVRRLTYPVWPAGNRLRGARLVRLTAQERLAKRRAIGGYRTQTGLITDDPRGFAMTRRQIALFGGPAETFVERRR